jgi:hypothetical protein
MYAKYISETTINTTIPKSGHDAQGRLVTGDLTNRPDVLALLNYFPVVEQEMPSEPIEGYHYEKRYAPPDSNDGIVQFWVSVEDPPPPPEPVKVYSKLKILMAADQAGIIDPLMDLIESDRKLKYIWDASNTIEDNALLSAYIPNIAQALAKTEQEVYAFLDNYCIAD